MQEQGQNYYYIITIIIVLAVVVALECNRYSKTKILRMQTSKERLQCSLHVVKKNPVGLQE